MLSVCVDECSAKKCGRNLPDTVNDRQQSNRTQNHSSAENSTPRVSSYADDYLVPTQYECVNQLGSNTEGYDQLDHTAIGVPPQQHAYCMLNIET